MEKSRTIKTDVLVIGAGIAGVMAAIKAGEQKADVTLASCTKIFSGSSFYPGTWGFGLVGPEDKEDEKDFIDTILNVGMGMADKTLVETFVSHITEGIDKLRKYEVPLKEAEDKGAAEFIPCFDHKNRQWNGLLQAGAKEALSKQLEKNHINLLPDVEIVQCFKNKGRMTGALGIHREQGFIRIFCKSIIIASGGLGGLFKYRLNTDDVTSMGQYLAMEMGATLVNLEFMQMMPGYLNPCPKTVFNEKVFRYSEFLDCETKKSIFEEDGTDWERALNERSTHGPFTSRMYSKYVDFRIFRHCMKDERGVTVHYKDALKKNQPEFIKTYFDWLKEKKNLTIEDDIQLGIFYHASNGGIMIDSDAATGVEGLFACGEATGGMHGADRIGGLSTANGLVFGSIAGRSAAEYAKKLDIVETEMEIDIPVVKDAARWIERLRQLNFETAMIFRQDDQIRKTLAEIEEIEQKTKDSTTSMGTDEFSYEELKTSCRLRAILALSKGLNQAVLMRKESRGSHYRADYPETDPEYGKRIVLHNGQTEFEIQK
ncbi:FAD-binding protein [Anaerobium acetethylicum]|uniref:L-aspartate oxidase n=1 Tax=Anaerobium acetethylicum TaxID=1619234 RepID=A0A1D3TP60_9FIRM|nr:FAD-binding protein [Anaerobium acetethylicum]SCP95135.1 L-aspartate oxidase [Anaerobium acetethylicum]